MFKRIGVVWLPQFFQDHTIRQAITRPKALYDAPKWCGKPRVPYNGGDTPVPDAVFHCGLDDVRIEWIDQLAGRCDRIASKTELLSRMSVMAIDYGYTSMETYLQRAWVLVVFVHT